MIRIEKFSNQYTKSVIELVNGILTTEFKFSESEAHQPDLLNVSEHYGYGRSNFCLALEDHRLVGTVGFVDLGGTHGLLRKMFVRRESRGGQVAPLLLERLLSWARTHGFEELFLGTNAKFHAAHRFYAKHGFEPVQPKDLPDTVPRIELRDAFFRRSLI